MNWRIASLMALSGVAFSPALLPGQENIPKDPITQKFMVTAVDSIAPPAQTMPLYDGPIPNSRPTPDEEGPSGFMQGIKNVSRPTLQAFLPAKAKANGTSIILLPGGGYAGLSIAMELGGVARNLQDHGYAAFIVKYRLPSDKTMVDKSIGPLQDAQQAVRQVREHAIEWKLDAKRVGVMGFSAGGHLAATLGTHFEKAYIDDPGNVSLRPDFMVLVYPVISMKLGITDIGTRRCLLGEQPAEERVKFFSNELQVTDRTPPTLLLHAEDDQIVDVDNSILFFEALRHHHVPVDMMIFDKGDHGFFRLARDDWQSVIFKWLDDNNWSRR
jgi:acetyl esterase/lipase